jgi:putative ABC transport system ATP-binding protein
MGASSMDEALVRAEDLVRVYGIGSRAVRAVSGATFSIEAGQRIALIGPSGSGKSTLLLLIAGLDSPNSGALMWPALGDRRDLRPGPIAMAFQGPSLLPQLNVIENVALPLLLEGRPQTDAVDAASVALDLFELGDVAGKLPEEVSGGQAQRAGLARAIVGEPRLILADEPTGQLDHETAGRAMLALLEAADASGAAIVVATHDPVVAERMDVRWRIGAGQLRAEVSGCSA